MADHEGHLLGGRLAGGHDEVALIFAVVIVNHDHHLASSDGFERVFNGIESGHGEYFT